MVQGNTSSALMLPRMISNRGGPCARGESNGVILALKGTKQLVDVSPVVIYGTTLRSNAHFVCEARHVLQQRKVLLDTHRARHGVISISILN